MARDVVINIEPFSIDSYIDSDGGLTLIFKTWTKKKPYRRKIIKVYIEFWWIKIISGILHEAIQRRKETTNEVENKLRNG